MLIRTDLLRRAKAASGLSYRELARATGISHPYLHQILIGRKIPSLHVLSVICRALNVPIVTVIVEGSELVAMEG